jgi:hypothetical protein
MDVGPIPTKLSIPVAASTEIYAGALVALSAGYLVPASADSSLVVLGKAEFDADNSAGSAGDINASVIVGAFRFDIHSSSITQANVGALAYAVDDQTVSSSSSASTRPVAGVIVSVDSTGAWVLCGPWTANVLPIQAVRQAQYLKVAADGAANTATAETAFARVQVAGTITGAWFVPSASLTGDPTNNAVLAVDKRDGAGGAAAAVASLTTTANWTAFVPVSLGALTNATVAAGNVLTFEISKGGTGVAVPAGSLIVAIAPA